MYQLLPARCEILLRYLNTGTSDRQQADWHINDLIMKLRTFAKRGNEYHYTAVVRLVS